MEQKERDNAMKEFRTGSTRILISTDLFGAGTVGQISNVVINYDLLRNRETYILQKKTDRSPFLSTVIYLMLFTV